MSIDCPSCLTPNPDGAMMCMSCGTPFASASGQPSQISLHLPPGTTLKKGQFQIEKTLGEGGFGITYKGKDLLNSREVAIKEFWWAEKFVRQGVTVMWSSSVPPQQQREQLEKFSEEARVLQKCQHLNIVRVYDWFSENNTAYMIMDLILGKSLLKILEENKRPLEENRVIKYFIQVADALKVVHRNNLLHRDIKPDNIMINQQDNAILIDFGNAREFTAGKTGNMTTTLSRFYAPLEQYASKGKRGPATDFYALCASMYEMLTGQLPEEATARVASDTLIPPRQTCPQISQHIERVILAGMRVRIEDRFQTADELIDALNGKFVSPSLRRSRELVQQNKLAEAISAYEQCLRNEPNNGEAAVELAIVQIYLNEAQAEIAAQKAIQLQPNDGRAYGVLGLINCRKSNWPEAIRQLQQAAKLSPYEAWIKANLAWALAKSGNWQQAEIEINNAVKIDNNSPFILGIQAWILANQQQWKSVIRAARPAITKSKQSPNSNELQIQRWVYPCLTIALDKAVVTQQATDVERCIQEFITQVPDSSFVWGIKGWKQAIQGLWGDALSSFEQAKRQGQPPAWVWLNLAITYEYLQNIQSAIQTYETYNQKFPLNPFSLFRLGTLLGRQQEWISARSYLEKSIQLKSDYAEAYHNLGWVLFNIKNPDGQIKNYREVLSAYKTATDLYAQQQKYALSQIINQAFQAIDISL